MRSLVNAGEAIMYLFKMLDEAKHRAMLRKRGRAISFLPTDAFLSDEHAISRCEAPKKKLRRSDSVGPE